MTGEFIAGITIASASGKIGFLIIDTIIIARLVITDEKVFADVVNKLYARC